MSCGRKIGPFACCSVVQGDCLDLMKQLPDGCVDAVITDPPYGVAFGGKSRKHTTRRNEGYIIPDSDIGLEAVPLALKLAKRGAIFPGTRLMFDYPKPQDMGAVHCPSGAGVGRWGWQCVHPVLFYGSRPRTELYPTCITSFHTAEPNGHPCPKPIEWMEWLVDMASLETDTILDPFCGSGTTLVAAAKLGRHFLGFEISEDYCAIARKRLAAVEAQPNLFQPKAEQALFCQTCGCTLADEQLLAIHMAAEHEVRAE